VFKRGFTNGFLAGGILGAIATMFIRPERKPDLMETITPKRLRGKSRQLEERAKDVVEEVSDSVSAMWKK